MKKSSTEAINRYLIHCKNSSWIYDEVYKFEFANYVNNRVDWTTQSDEEILDICLESQNQKYTSGVTGIQFIQVSGTDKPGHFISLKDVELFRRVFEGKEFDKVDWSDRTMSYTGLSAWLGTLFPNKIYPAPTKGFDETIRYLLNPKDEKSPKIGLPYIAHCQDYFQEMELVLREYPFEEIFLPRLNEYFRENGHLNIAPKNHLEKIDWVWLVQDFNLFVMRRILNLYKDKVSVEDIPDDYEPVAVEGTSKLATHLRYERNSGFIKKIKAERLKNNPTLNCEVCGFSFVETYGEAGKGFIEAHHVNPLSEREDDSVTKKEDIALLCSNCHRMAHKGDPVFEIDVLKEMLNNS